MGNPLPRPLLLRETEKSQSAQVHCNCRCIDLLGSVSQIVRKIRFYQANLCTYMKFRFTWASCFVCFLVFAQQSSLARLGWRLIDLSNAVSTARARGKLPLCGCRTLGKSPTLAGLRVLAWDTGMTAAPPLIFLRSQMPRAGAGGRQAGGGWSLLRGRAIIPGVN